MRKITSLFEKDDGINLVKRLQQRMMWAAIIMTIVTGLVAFVGKCYVHLTLRFATGAGRMWKVTLAWARFQIKIPISAIAIFAAICALTVVTFAVGLPSAFFTAIMLVLAVTLVIMVAKLAAKIISAMKQTDFRFFNAFDFATNGPGTGFFGHTTSAKHTGFDTNMKKMDSGSHNHQRFSLGRIGTKILPFTSTKVSGLTEQVSIRQQRTIASSSVVSHGQTYTGI